MKKRNCVSLFINYGFFLINLQFAITIWVPFRYHVIYLILSVFCCWYLTIFWRVRYSKVSFLLQFSLIVGTHNDLAKTVAIALQLGHFDLTIN